MIFLNICNCVNNAHFCKSGHIYLYIGTYCDVHDLNKVYTYNYYVKTLCLLIVLTAGTLLVMLHVQAAAFV